MSCHENIYEKANYIVKKFNTRCPKTIIESMNILIATTHTKNLLGMYTVINRKRIILISDSLNYLDHLIMAHELGHDQLHRNECKSGKVFYDEPCPPSLNIFELEANIFAAHLLIEDNKLKQLLAQEQTLLQIANEFKVTEELVFLKIKELILLNILDEKLWESINYSNEFLKYYCPDPLANY